MRMKKIFLVLAAVALCASTVSAQNDFKQAVQTIASQKWSVGLRAGSTVQAVAECFYGDNTYVEGRFGMTALFGSANAPVAADLTVLHNWNCFNWDWTPSTGKWFFDAGVGLSVGGGAHTAYVGVAGNAKLGIKFNAAPIRLSVDWTPVFGPGFLYTKDASHCGFPSLNIANFGISATYCF
jgi:hypothetical protein